MVSRGRILVVDDDRDCVEVVEGILADEGWKVEIAYDGQSAIAFALKTAFNLIILDLRIPIKDGWEVLEKIRGEGVTSPVAIATGDAQVAEQLVHDRGAQIILRKPYSIETLLRVVATFDEGLHEKERYP